MGTRESRRPIDLGRRIEALPVWVFVLLVVAVRGAGAGGVLRHTSPPAADGTDCGPAIFDERAETMEYAVAGCQAVITDALPVVFGLGALAVALVLASAVTVIVRGWSPVEPPPWPTA